LKNLSLEDALSHAVVVQLIMISKRHVFGNKVGLHGWTHNGNGATYIQIAMVAQ